MSAERTRERIVDIVRKMRENTVDRGCTPAEAAYFAAKAAELVEKHQIGEAELRAREEGGAPEMEFCQNYLRTGKKVHNPGMTAVVNGLARGMCCECIMLHIKNEAVYGIIGETMDTDYVCQIAVTVVPALQIMATAEGREHGEEKAGLVRWSNQYLMGAGEEIRKRLERDRKERSEARLLEHQLSNSTALVPITGESLAVQKREGSKAVLKDLYPVTRQVQSRTTYDHTARERGREAGKRVGLHRTIEQK